jgi:hypothetical protein
MEIQIFVYQLFMENISHTDICGKPQHADKLMQFCLSLEHIFYNRYSYGDIRLYSLQQALSNSI